MTNELSNYNAAKRALSLARTVDEVKDIRDKAMAMRLYAQQAKDRSLEADALEIRLRAERKIGEMMAAEREAGRLEKNQHTRAGVTRTPACAGVTRTPTHQVALTLASQGINKELAKVEYKEQDHSEGLLQ